MKRVGITIIVLLIFIAIGQRFSQKNEWKLVSEELNKSGLKIEKIDVEGHGFFSSKEDLETIIKKIYSSSGIKASFVLQRKNDEIQLSNERASLKVKRVNKENLNYVSFTLSQYMEVENIINIKSGISRGFKSYDVIPTFSYLIGAKYHKKMSINEMKNRASEILLLCGSNYISGMEDRNLVSYIGLSPLFHEKTSILNKFVNLNIALRYIKEKGITYVWIGSPIIATEY